MQNLSLRLMLNLYANVWALTANSSVHAYFQGHKTTTVCGYFKNADFYFTYSISTIGADIIEMIGADLKTVFRAVTDMLFANADGV